MSRRPREGDCQGRYSATTLNAAGVACATAAVRLFDDRLASFERRERAGVPCYRSSPSCFACSAASQKAEMTMSWSPSHLLVWPNSRSKAFPVGGITLPAGRVILPVKVPGTLVSESEVPEVDRDHQDIADGSQVRRVQVGTKPGPKSDPIDVDDVAHI